MIAVSLNAYQVGLHHRGIITIMFELVSVMVGWSLTSLFSTKTAISEIKGQG